MLRWRILVAGDAGIRDPLVAGLVADGHPVDTTSSARDALELMRQHEYAVSVVDLAGDGFKILADMRQLRPGCSFLVLAEAAAADSFSNSLRKEPIEMAVKPCRPDDICGRARRLIEIQALRRENAALRDQVARNMAPGTGTLSAGLKLSEMEKLLVAATIQQTHGNIKEAASVLGIDRSTLYEKIKRYGIPRH